MIAPTKPKAEGLKTSRQILSVLIQMYAPSGAYAGGSAPDASGNTVTNLFLGSGGSLPKLHLVTGSYDDERDCHLAYQGLLRHQVRQDEPDQKELARLQVVLFTCPETGELRVGPFLHEADGCTFSEKLAFLLNEQDRKTPDTIASEIFGLLSRGGTNGTLSTIFDGHARKMQC